jgi:integrase/recombinase XerD
MGRVNILKQVKTPTGWRRVALARNAKGQIRWDSRPVNYIIEWRENGRRLRAAAGVTPSEAREGQKRKRFELEARETGLSVSQPEVQQQILLASCTKDFLTDIRTFRRPATHDRYRYILGIFSKFIAPKSDIREINTDDIKKFLAWRKSTGCDPGTTLYTDRVILHNFFNRLDIDNPVKQVPRLAKFRKRPVAYPTTELQAFFRVCNEWERAFFTLALATGLRRGELQTLHWPDLDLVERCVHVRAKPQYKFLPKDWEERTVPFSKEVALVLGKHKPVPNCPIVFPSPKSHLNYRFLHDRCKEIAKRAGLNPTEWHLHRFRDTAATRWLRAGIDVRTVQLWLGHESLATTQKYLEPSRETANQLDAMKLPF